MRLARISCLAALALLACGGEPDGAPKPGHGFVRGLDAPGGTVTLEHGEIPDLMLPMTMTFFVDDPAILAGLSVGDEVDFRVALDGKRYVVTEIQRSP